MLDFLLNKVQKQSFTDVPQSVCSKKFGKIHMKALDLEYFFNKVADL